LRESDTLNQFLDWLVASVIELDDSFRRVAKMEFRRGIETRGRKELYVGAGATRKLSIYYRLLTEMAFCRAVDNYLIYLTDLLELIFLARPEALRSKEEVRLDFVLAAPTRAKLIKALFDRKVNQLSYQGMRDLAVFLSERLSFELFDRAASLSRAILLVEIRNVVTHNRGIVNDTFLRRVPDSQFPTGKQIKMSIGEVKDHIAFLAKSVSVIESRAHDKFGVKPPYKMPSRPPLKQVSSAPERTDVICD